jgi:hypothetical protein
MGYCIVGEWSGLVSMFWADWCPGTGGRDGWTEQPRHATGYASEALAQATLERLRGAHRVPWNYENVRVVPLLQARMGQGVRVKDRYLIRPMS